MYDGLLKGYQFFKQFNDILGYTGSGKYYDLLIRKFRDEELEYMLSVLSSRYNSDGTFTNYAGLLKAIAHEASRLKIGILQVKYDLFYEETRGEFLNQNLAEFLFTGERFPGAGFSDQSFRNFLLSILKAYLGGSTKSNMEEALTIFSNLTITLRENIKRSLDDETYYDIADQFKFLVDVEIEGNVDFQELQENFNFILNLIKPAHTNQFVRFIFKEVFDFQAGCDYVRDEFGNIIFDDQGWPLQTKNAPTAICEKHKINYFDYFYDDIRKVCDLEQEEICIEKEDVTTQPSVRPVYTWDQKNIKIPVVQDPRDYHTRYGPFTDGSGNGTVTYNKDDVTAYVNGVEVEIEEIFPLSATVRLKLVPPIDATIEISYCYFQNPTIGITYNDKDRVLNSYGSDTLTEFQYKAVLSPITNVDGGQEIPPTLETEYKYLAFELKNSSLLNCPPNLILNKHDSLRHRFNDYSIMKSWGYDEGEYNTKLPCDTPIVPIRLEYGNFGIFYGLEEFKLNDSFSELNIVVDKLYDPDIHTRKFIEDELEKYYGSLRITKRDNGGVCNLEPYCEGPMQFGISFTNDATSQYHFKTMPDSIIYYNLPNTVLNDNDILYQDNAIEMEMEIDLGTKEETWPKSLIDELHQTIGILETDYRCKNKNIIYNNANTTQNNNDWWIPCTKWGIIDQLLAIEETYLFDDQFDEIDDALTVTTEKILSDQYNTQEILDIPTYWSFFFTDQKERGFIDLNHPERHMNTYDIFRLPEGASFIELNKVAKNMNDANDIFYKHDLASRITPPPWFIAKLVSLGFTFNEDPYAAMDELNLFISETQSFVEQVYDEVQDEAPVIQISQFFTDQRGFVDYIELNDANSLLTTPDILYKSGFLPRKPLFTNRLLEAINTNINDEYDIEDIDDESHVLMTITTGGSPINYQLTGKTWQVI